MLRATNSKSSEIKWQLMQTAISNGKLLPGLSSRLQPQDPRVVQPSQAAGGRAARSRQGQAGTAPLDPNPHISGEPAGQEWRVLSGMPTVGNEGTPPSLLPGQLQAHTAHGKPASLRAEPTERPVGGGTCSVQAAGPASA